MADAQQWMKQIEDIKHKSFKKIRIGGKSKPQDSELQALMKSKLELRTKLMGICDPLSGNKIKENISLI